MNQQKIGYARVSTTDQNLERQLDMLRQQGAEIIFQEKLTGTKRDRPELNKLLAHIAPGDDTSTPTGKLLFTLMSALAQFERDVIAERTKEGLRAARARGRKGGRPRCDQHKLQQALKLYEAGKHTLAEIEELTGIKKATLYRARGTVNPGVLMQNISPYYIQI